MTHVVSDEISNYLLILPITKKEYTPNLAHRQKTIQDAQRIEKNKNI